MELPDDTDDVVFVSHKLVRQPKYKGKWKEKFLKFYLIDQSGREQLAATAEDTGDAHYIYTSSENFKNYGVVSCRNREELILWLEMVIKKSQMKAAGHKNSGETESFSDFAGFQFVGHRLEKLILEDGRRCNRWYLVDSESNEHLAVVGKERCASDGHYDYKAEEPFASRYPLRCSNLQGVLRWVAHMITPQAGHHGSISVPTTRGTPLANNSGSNTPGDYTPSGKSPARNFTLQASSNPSKRRKLTPGSLHSQGTAAAEELFLSRPRWEGSQQPQHQHVKIARARQSSVDCDVVAPQKERQANHEDMLIADALVDLQQDPSQAVGFVQQAHLKVAESGGAEGIGQMVSAMDMAGIPDSIAGAAVESHGVSHSTNINQKLIFDPQLQCQWSMRARNAIIVKGKVLARMKAGVYVYDSEQQELVRLEDTAYNRMKARIKDSFGKVFPNLAVEQNIIDPCHPAFKVTPSGTVSVGLFATDHLGPGTILGDYLYRAVLETYAENEHYVMMDPTGKRALQEMYSMDLAFTSSWESDALVALGHPARNTLACMNDYRALSQGSNRAERQMCRNTSCNCHSYTRRTPNVELLETIEITPQRTIIPHLLVLTKRRVAHGDEILWDFGADFWERYEALVRRVHYVEGQSQELERLKHTVEMSQHQLAALQNYIYEREQVISKLQQVMTMHGLNAEQSLQMQLSYQPLVQHTSCRLTTMNAVDTAMPTQAPPATTNQVLCPPVCGDVVANNVPTQPSDSEPPPMHHTQNVPYTNQLQSGLMDVEVAGLALPGTQERLDSNEQTHTLHLGVMQSQLPKARVAPVPLEQMQATAGHLPAGALHTQSEQFPLTLQDTQQQGSGGHLMTAEQLPTGANVQFLPGQTLPAEDAQQLQHEAESCTRVTAKQMQTAHGHVQQLQDQLHLSQSRGDALQPSYSQVPTVQQLEGQQVQAQVVMAQGVQVVIPCHNAQLAEPDDMKQEDTTAAAIHISQEQMQLMANHMQQLAHIHVAPVQQDSGNWRQEKVGEAGERWASNQTGSKQPATASVPLVFLHNPVNEATPQDKETYVQRVQQHIAQQAVAHLATHMSAAEQLQIGIADMQHLQRAEPAPSMAQDGVYALSAAQLHAQAEMLAAGQHSAWAVEQVHVPVPGHAELQQSSSQAAPTSLQREDPPQYAQSQVASPTDATLMLPVDTTDLVARASAHAQHDSQAAEHVSVGPIHMNVVPLAYQTSGMAPMNGKPQCCQQEKGAESSLAVGST